MKQSAFRLNWSNTRESGNINIRIKCCYSPNPYFTTNASGLPLTRLSACDHLSLFFSFICCHNFSFYWSQWWERFSAHLKLTVLFLQENNGKKSDLRMYSDTVQNPHLTAKSQYAWCYRIIISYFSVLWDRSSGSGGGK